MNKARAKAKLEVVDLTPDSVKRAVTAERNVRKRMWQLIVAVSVSVAVIAGVVWQIFLKAS